MPHSNFIKAGRKNCAKVTAARSHWVIEGQPFASASAAYAVAKSKGSTLSLPAFAARLKRGEKTWSELLASPKTENGTARSIDTRKRKRDEMAELIAGLDQRKRDMGIEP